MKGSWPAAMSRRIGVKGAISMSPFRGGMTLHIPCERGRHLVDFPVEPGMHPDLVAKRMLSKGWTFGTKLCCPDHSRREKPAKAKEETMPKPAPMNVSPRTKNLTPEQRSEAARNLVARRINKNKEPEAMPPTPVPSPALSIVSSETAAAPMSERTPTEAAKKAKRLIYQCLEDYYDDQSKRYREDGRGIPYTDQRIAQETGASVAFVREIREADFGPIGCPPELRALFDQLDGLKAKIRDYRDEFQHRMLADEERLAEMHNKLSALCRAKGWPEPV